MDAINGPSRGINSRSLLYHGRDSLTMATIVQLWRLWGVFAPCSDCGDYGDQGG